MGCVLIKPDARHLAEYIRALETGWSPNVLDEAKAARNELEAIAKDAAGFIASLEDREARGGPIELPDGSITPRLPGYRRWIWDGEFCGSIGLRWQVGTSELPPSCLGHIGYSVIPAKRQKGYATVALKLMLQDAKALGMRFIYIHAQPENIGSQKVILANGGIFLEHMRMPAAYGYKADNRYRIDL